MQKLSKQTTKKMSIESPIGKALKGHEVGNVVTFKSETNKVSTIEILTIE